MSMYEAPIITPVIQVLAWSPERWWQSGLRWLSEAILSETQGGLVTEKKSI